MNKMAEFLYCISPDFITNVFKDSVPELADRKDVHVRIFNPSHIRLSAFSYLCCARFVIAIGDEPIPGNSLSCPRPMKVGRNFWWNNWQNPKWKYAGTIFFHYDIFTCQPKFLPIDPNDGTDNLYIQSLYEDARLCCVGNDIWYYNSNMSKIFKVTYKTGGNRIDHVSLELMERGIDEYGKNQSLICYNPITEHYVVANIFGKTGVELLVYSEKKKINTMIIPYKTNKLHFDGCHLTNNEQDKIHFGVNYGIMPCISFGTPHIPLGKDIYLGVGHIKIHTDELDYPYLEGSNIDRFRSKAYTKMQEFFGDNFVRHKGSVDYICGKCFCYPDGTPMDKTIKVSEGECNHKYIPRYVCSTSTHQYSSTCYDEYEMKRNYPAAKDMSSVGYIYMMFYYTIDLANMTMKMSNAFVPVGTTNKYQFLLSFPTGLSFDTFQRMVSISYGDGDLYSCMYHENIDIILDTIQHDVSDINFANYKYKIRWKYIVNN